jgi:cytochrome c oxidase subunit 4
MVLVVLLISMEVAHDTPLIRVFSMLGFFWVLIMFTMTLTDYLAR